MSILLSPKFNQINRSSSIHKDRNKRKKSDVIDLKKEIDVKLNEIMHKPYFIHRRLTRTKLESLIRDIIKDELEEIIYISEHLRYTLHVQNYARKTINEINQTIDKMVKVGME